MQSLGQRLPEIARDCTNEGLLQRYMRRRHITPEVQKIEISPVQDVKRIELLPWSVPLWLLLICWAQDEPLTLKS